MTPNELAALHAQCFITPRPYTAAEFATVLEGRGTFLLEGRASFVIGRVIAQEAELLTLAVHPGLRRRGLGHALLTSFLDAAQHRGATTAFLDVADDNAAAQALYAAHGFVEITRRTNYYRTPKGHRMDAIMMMRDIEPSPT